MFVYVFLVLCLFVCLFLCLFVCLLVGWLVGWFVCGFVCFSFCVFDCFTLFTSMLADHLCCFCLYSVGDLSVLKHCSLFEKASHRIPESTGRIGSWVAKKDNTLSEAHKWALFEASESDQYLFHDDNNWSCYTIYRSRYTVEFSLDVYGHIMCTGKSFPDTAMHSMTFCANF